MFYLSSSCSSHNDIYDSVKSILNHGVKNIELSGNLILNNNWREVVSMFEKKIGVNFIIHNYFPNIQNNEFILNIASENSPTLNMSFEIIREAVKLMDDTHIPLYSIHAGAAAFLILRENEFCVADKNKIVDKSRAEMTLYSNIDFIINDIFKHRHRIAIENMFPDSKHNDIYLMTKPDEILHYLKYSMKYENLGFLFDLGHLSVASDTFGFDKEEFAREVFYNYSDKIFELHISENDGTFDQHKINHDNSWQLNILHEFQSVVKDIPVVFEWRNGHNLKDICRRYFEVQTNMCRNII